MDYSLLVGIQEAPKAEYDANPDMFKSMHPFSSDLPVINLIDQGRTVQCIYLGVIDFLQDWSTGKKIAHCIKCTFAPKPISTVAPKPYSKQFYEHFAQNFTATAEPIAVSGGVPPHVPTAVARNYIDASTPAKAQNVEFHNLVSYIVEL